jgi:hypothetical protein
MLKRNTIVVAVIAVCGVTLALGASMGLQPLIANQRASSTREEGPPAFNSQVMPNAL